MVDRSPHARLAVPAAVLLTGLGLAVTGCSRASPPPPPSSSAGSTAASPTAAPSSSSTTPAAAPSLGGRCDDLLSVSTVSEVLGRPVIGSTSFVLGVAEPNIGRLTYLNCRYGIGKAVKGKPAPQPQLEIGVSLYDSAEQASRRVRGTVDDYVSHGARQIKTSVNGLPATILAGYGNPTLVVADGPRTVAVTAATPLIALAPAANLQKLASTALTGTANFTGVPGVTASASAAPAGSGSASGSASPSDTAS